MLKELNEYYWHGQKDSDSDSDKGSAEGEASADAETQEEAAEEAKLKALTGGKGADGDTRDASGFTPPGSRPSGGGSSEAMRARERELGRRRSAQWGVLPSKKNAKPRPRHK